jgi:hypothetical protein
MYLDAQLGGSVVFICQQQRCQCTVAYDATGRLSDGDDDDDAGEK